VALYSVASGQPPAAADLNQVINLLSGASSPTSSSMQVANRIRAQLTGATATSGLVGSTSGGAPASGTFALGDLVVDTGYNCLWVCTGAGTPGTWKRIGGQTWTSVNWISTGVGSIAFPPDQTTGNFPPAPTAINQTFFTRSGRVGFDVIQANYQVPEFYPYLFPGFSDSAYGYTIPLTGTYLVTNYLAPSGPTGGTDLGSMILKNGQVYQYGTETLSFGSATHKATSIVHCTAGDLIQVGAYAEGQYSPTASSFQAGFRIAYIGN